MFRKILGTIGTKVMTSVITLLIVVINARFLGAEKVGTINLVIPAIAIVTLVNNFVGGPALVYLLPRTGLMKLFIPSYLWAFVASGIVTAVLGLLHLIPAGFYLHVMFLSLLTSLSSVNFMVLLGQEKIRPYNLISLMQMIFQILVLVGMIFLFHLRDPLAYIIALYVSYGFSFLLGLILVFPSLGRGSFSGSGSVLKEIFRYGMIMQAGNIAQLLNYRSSYYFLEYFFGRAMVGIYSVGVQLSEGIWLVGRSIALVQYARISNEEDRAYAVRLTLDLVKFTCVLTVITMIILLLLPVQVFTFIFGAEFFPVKMVMYSLAAGILMFSVSIILSPFFSGIGKPQYNTISAVIGLVFTVLFCLLLIPRYGMAGAGIAASVSYTASALYQLIQFFRISRIRIRDMRITRDDFRKVWRAVRSNVSE
jgi:O-antigen/teichoic acid export membrane protein